MTKDVSVAGVLFQSRGRFETGERVVVTFAQGGGRASVSGTVVRTELAAEPSVLFPHVTAVRFDAPVDEV